MTKLTSVKNMRFVPAIDLCETDDLRNMVNSFECSCLGVVFFSTWVKRLDVFLG